MKEVIIDTEGNILLAAGETEMAVLPDTVEDTSGEGVYIFEICGVRARARFAAESDSLRGLTAETLRGSYGKLSASDYRVAVKGAELLKLDLTTHYCGHCGARMHRGADGLSKSCPECGAEVFPQVSPCVIVLVTKGDKALLVQGRNMRGGVHGLVAGFVETGETLEECVHREVMEETSLKITDLRYVGSQPWPSPANLMCAFRAEYAGGEICFADGELRGGGFFGRDELPELPSGASIARRLIEDWRSDKL